MKNSKPKNSLIPKMRDELNAIEADIKSLKKEIKEIDSLLKME